jgi:hypothetical protein
MSLFWGATLYSLVKVSQHFGRTYHRHLQGQRVSQARNQNETGMPEDGGNVFLQNVVS